MTLSATRAKALKDPGRYSDGGGLHLYISKAGGKSWVQRITIDGRRRDIGLGGFPSVSLARAREKAAENRAAVAEGRDPLADRHAPAMPTFREAAGAAHEANRPRWRNGQAHRQLMQTLERHAMPTLGATPLGRIDRGEVLRVLTPIWTTRPETAQALELLGEASALRDESGLVFPSPLKPGAPMSDMTLTKRLRSTGLSERATVHGFRSNFKNWTLEQTDTPPGPYRRRPLPISWATPRNRHTPGPICSSAAGH